MSPQQEDRYTLKSAQSGGADRQQLDAIYATEGPLLIIAGPGSGKTKTLVERVVHLVRQGIDPTRLMVATFTEKAASELISRISDRLIQLNYSVNLNEMFIGTLHSIFLRILDENREYTSFRRNYRVLDQFEQHYLIFRKLRDFQNIPGVTDLLQAASRSVWDAAEVAVSFINKVSEECLNVPSLIASPDPDISAIGRLYLEYQSLLEEENVIDFSTIQVEILRLIENHPSILKIYQERIQYLMVDEYQDTNTIQEKLLLRLCSTHSNICVVGDDDQGLYRFRGATIRNILEFPKNFPIGACRTIELITNYRSTPDIVQFYNRWMQIPSWSANGISFRHSKTIRPHVGSFPDSASVIRISSNGSPSDYHQEVLDFIRHIQTTGNLSDLNQIAFLFRSVKNPHVLALGQFLEANGIPVFSPRSALFFQRDEIKLSLGALIFIFPRLFDDLKWSPSAQLDVWAYYKQCKDFFADSLRENRVLHAKLITWSQAYSRSHLTLATETNYRFSNLLYELFQFPMFRKFLEIDLNGKAYDLRASYNLALFSQLLTRFEHIHNVIVITPKSFQKDLCDLFNRYLRFLVEGGLGEFDKFDQIAPKGCVSFMTIHQCKGLEFPVVLVGSLDATPRNQYTDLDRKLQANHYPKPPFEPDSLIKIFDFWRLYYTAFSRPQNILGLITREERNKPKINQTLSAIKIPRKEFQSVYAPLPSWRDSRFDVSKITLEHLRAANVKAEYSFTSHVLLYENCPLQYKFFKELEFSEVRRSGSMVGTLIHQTIEDIHKVVLRGEEHKLTEDNIRGWFESNYRSLSIALKTYLADPQLISILEQVMRYHDRQNGNWSHLKAAEVDVSLVMEDYILKGTIDLIEGLTPGWVDIVDFKSGKKPILSAQDDRKLLERYQRQLEIYAHLVEERTGQKVERMHLHYTSEKDGLPTISFERSKMDLNKTIQTFDAVVQKIENKDYSMTHIVKSEKLCGNCDMNFHCNHKA